MKRLLTESSPDIPYLFAQKNIKAGPVLKAFNFSLVLFSTCLEFFFFWNLIPTLHFRTTSGKIVSVLKIFSHGEKAAQEHFPEAREFPPITSLHPTLHSSFFQLPGTAGYDSIMCLRCLWFHILFFCCFFVSVTPTLHSIFPLLWLLVLPK